MLRTPLQPRFYREGRRFLVAAPEPYLWLIRATWISGGVFLGFGLLFVVLGTEFIGLPGQFWSVLGLAVMTAGFLASFSLDFADFDNREKTFRRRQGSWVGRSLTNGKFAEIDHLAFFYGNQMNFTVQTPTAQLVLFFKNPHQPPLVVYSGIFPPPPAYLNPNTPREQVRIQPGKTPILNNVMMVQQFGAIIAQALAVPYRG